MLHAPQCPAGFLPVVIDGGFGGVILHEACVHSLEATSVAKGNSEFCGKLGQQIASPLVTAIDDGTLPGEWGSIRVDDEGAPSQRNVLIEKGVLKTYLVDTLERMAEGGPTQYLNAIFRDVAEKWCTSESGVAEAVRRDMAKMYRAKTPFYQSLRLPDNNGKPPSIGKFLGAFAFYLQPLPEALLRERSI